MKLPPRGTHVDDLKCKRCGKKRKEADKKKCDAGECKPKDK